MMRLCPNCTTERPLTEIFCEGAVGDHTCHWDLSQVEISPSGKAARIPAPGQPSPTVTAPEVCRNGHPIAQGDLICLVCGEMIGETVMPAPTVAEPLASGEPEAETIVEGWRLHERIAASRAVHERFLAVRESDGRRGVLTLYAAGFEPDQTVYDVLRKLSREHVPEIWATGRWNDRAYEVVEEITGGTLSGVTLSPTDTSTARRVVEQVGEALRAFSEAGLRHRDLRPGVVLVRSHEPLDLVITGFGSARLSDFDLDIASVLETTRYMAPEAIVGGVASASDWWSLGMLLLEGVTGGACFAGVNEHAFLIHVLTNGVAIPPDIDSSLALMLRGLLARDRRQRWQWEETRAWLAGEPVDAPEAPVTNETAAGTSILLAGTQYRSAETFALAAADPANWDEARDKLARGGVATWAAEAGLDQKLSAGLRQLAHVQGLSDDLRLSIALKMLNLAMPLIVRGNILTPGWLLDHAEEGYALITGPAPDLLRRIDPDDWLSRLKNRAENVRRRIQQLEIEVEEEALKVNLLSTSMARLKALWEERRKILPDTDHPGIISLIERRQSAEEDLVILLSASIAQFRSMDEVVEEAAKEAAAAGISSFSAADAGKRLVGPRREIYLAVDERIANFSRCNVLAADEWADQFRLDRRMPIARALALLAVPRDAWKELPRQGYVSTILEFFAKRITGGVLRGPLTRMLIGKSAARVDLTELGTERVPARDILENLLTRGGHNISVDPAAFAESDTLERRLRSLHSHALLYRRDTGIDGLYMGFPFLLTKDARGNTKPRIAPVLLWPLRVMPETGNRGHFTLGFGRDRSEGGDPDQVVLNPAFEGIMGFSEARRWQESADDLLARASFSAADVMDVFGQLADARGNTIAPLPGKDTDVKIYRAELSPSAVLFHLAFMGQAVVKDLQLLKGRSPTGTGLETALRLHGDDRPGESAPRAREIEKYFTADSDPSQEAAVIEARQAPGLVVEGPPGTGKSQTIVNMVADAIGTGKSLLVICQKQAALEVVRKRLDKEQLSERFIMITDINSDRRTIVGSIREQVQALHARPTGGAPEWKRERERLAARIEFLESDLDRQQAALHQVDEPTGLTYRTLIGELLALEAVHPPPLDVARLRPLLARLHPADITTIEETCAPLTKYWLPSKFEDSTLSVLKLFNPDRGTTDAFTDGLRLFAETEQRREQTDSETEDSLPTNDAQMLRAWLSYADDLRSIGPGLCGNLARWLPLFRATDGFESDGEMMLADLVGIQAEILSLDPSLLAPRISEKLVTPSDKEMRDVATLAAAVVRPASGLGRLNPTRWVRRRRLGKLLLSMAIEQDETSIHAIEGAIRLEVALRPLRSRLRQHLETLLTHAPDRGFGPRQLAELAENMHSIVSRVRDLVIVVHECPHREELEDAARAGTTDALRDFFQRAEHSLRRSDARSLSVAALDTLAFYVDEQWLASRRAAIAKGRSNDVAISAIANSLPTLVSFQEFRVRSVRIGEVERAIFGILRTKEADLAALAPSDLAGCVRRTIAREARHAWKGRIERSNPEVLFDSDALGTKTAALADADAQIRNRNRDLLVQDIDVRRVRPPRDWDQFTRLAGPRALRLREFIERATDLGLLALRPIWLMTPDVASRVLQPKPAMFDTVIFDEASQMPVEYALPALFRSKIVVVSGDEKQMPPTAFFSSKVENDEAAIFDGEEPEENATEDERDAFTETWNRREIKDCPDLLQLARTVLPVKTLQVHYRSKYRELISFSNASFYGNRLSVPVRHPDDVIRKVRPIEVIRSDGVYKNQTNLKEAADVVDHLARMWTRPSPPTLGVVTFNRKQADAIEDALEQRAEGDSAFRDALMRERERIESGEDVGFFVKNVENVQGDERDVIVFSTTFGKNEQDRFHKIFGALGHVGGERRLNVAVTRAREKIVIMTSMPVSEISTLLSTRRRPTGPRDYLQAYLEYARTVSEGAGDAGRALLERLVTERSHDHDRAPREEDGFTASVGQFLRASGWDPADAHDGGAFSLDFAITNPRTGLYAIGIECDAPRHMLLRTARAREVWRPRVLRGAIPNVHRISSYAWMHSAKTERDRLQLAVEQALQSEGQRP